MQRLGFIYLLGAVVTVALPGSVSFTQAHGKPEPNPTDVSGALRCSCGPCVKMHCSGWPSEFWKRLRGPPSIWLSRRAAVYSLTQHSICAFVDVQLHGMQRRQKVLLCCFRVISNTLAKCPQTHLPAGGGSPRPGTARRDGCAGSSALAQQRCGDGCTEFAARLCRKTAPGTGRGSESAAGASSVQSLFLSGIS